TISPCLCTKMWAGFIVTLPGPRNLWNDTVATDEGPPRAAAVSASPGALGSSTHTFIGTGWFTLPVYVDDTAVGGPVTLAPPCENVRIGGWLPIPSSLNGLI